LFYIADAGTRWAYHNAPYTLLSDVINNATGTTLNAYTTDKLKTPTGMTGLFVNIGYLNIFYSSARSMARFGLLMLNNGNWAGNQIMTDTAYFSQMVNTSQPMNPSYGYLWWLNGKSSYMLPETQTVYNGFVNPNAPADLIMAIGAAGQFLNIVPSQNLVFVRMGNTPLGLPEFSYLMNDKIWEYLNDLECNTTGLNDNNTNENFIHLFPNPCNDRMNIQSETTISKVEIFNPQGQLIKTVSSHNKELSISIDGLLNGLYFVKVSLNNGNMWTGKIIKE
jgi:CubicO group peptidase (beta-lactamase class C family)